MGHAVLLRNHLFFLGLSAVASGMLAPVAAWLPGTSYLLVCWCLGTKDAYATPWWWALPNLLPDHLAAMLVAGVVWVLALGMQVLGLSRPHDGQ